MFLPITMEQRLGLHPWTLQLCWRKSWRRRLKRSNYGSNWFGKASHARWKDLVVVLRIKEHKWIWPLTRFENHTEYFFHFPTAWNLSVRDNFKQMCLISNVLPKDGARCSAEWETQTPGPWGPPAMAPICPLQTADHQSQTTSATNGFANVSGAL